MYAANIYILQSLWLIIHFPFHFPLISSPYGGQNHRMQERGSHLAQRFPTVNVIGNPKLTEEREKKPHYQTSSE